MANIRQELTNVLTEAGVEFPTTATTTQLRRLLRDVVGATRSTEISRNDDNLNSAATAGTAAVDATATADVFTSADDTAGTDTNAAISATAATNATAAIDTTAAIDIIAASDVFDSAATDVRAAADATNTRNCGRTSMFIGLDEEIAALQKRVEILKLAKQIKELEGRPKNQSIRRLEFGDLEHAIPKFSGDDVTLTVNQFLKDFEDLMESTGADDRFKLLALRRSLTGTAKVFLTTTVALNYGALRKALKDEFDISVTRHEIYKMLAQRRWKQTNESLKNI